MSKNRLGSRLMLSMLPIFFLIFTQGCATKIGSNEVGVKVYKAIFTNQVIDKPYTAGTYFYIPFISSFYSFDRSQQKLEFHDKSALRLKTSDGNDISIDAAVIYAIDATNVSKLIQEVGPDVDYKTELIEPTAQSVIRTVIGELSTEDMYNSGLRSEKASRAMLIMNEKFSSMGVQVVQVLIRKFKFSETYEAKIIEKKNYDQDYEKYKSQVEAQKENTERKRNAGIAEATKLLAEAEGKFNMAKIESDAYLARKSEEANGIIAQKQAEAKGILELAKAMEGAGGSMIVKQRVADALNGKRIIMIPSDGKAIATIDLNRYMASKFVTDTESEK